MIVIAARGLTRARPSARVSALRAARATRNQSSAPPDGFPFWGCLSLVTITIGADILSASSCERHIARLNAPYWAATKKLRGDMPGTDEALNQMKGYCHVFAPWVPGWECSADSVFQRLDELREKHRREVDEIVSDVYLQLKKLSMSSKRSAGTGMTWEGKMMCLEQDRVHEAHDVFEILIHMKERLENLENQQRGTKDAGHDTNFWLSTLSTGPPRSEILARVGAEQRGEPGKKLVHETMDARRPMLETKTQHAEGIARKH
ncbi:hypothetical protein GGR56DRAFT_655698 [Xylariaceae sp. FL0804]|nr:hypothetical protein GGR56DRAFT_655698 [Xylariaceae sp. FL0804]